MKKSNPRLYRLVWVVVVALIMVLGLLLQLRLDRSHAQVRLRQGLVFPVQKTTDKGVMEQSNAVIIRRHSAYRGVDIYSEDRTDVVAAKGGEVILARETRQCGQDYGSELIIRGIDGLYYHYAHMRPGSVTVKTGDVLETGEEIGKIDAGECNSGDKSYLIFEVSRFMTTNRRAWWINLIMIDSQSVLNELLVTLPKQ